MPADLHLHTCHSDGTFSPVELVAGASTHGLDTIALTDHDTLSGCEETRRECDRREIRFIIGSELTADLEGKEIHILGLFLDPTEPQLRAELKACRTARADRIHEMVRRINELGVELDMETVSRVASCDSPGRPHVARALVETGVCGGMQEAFERFLKRGKPGWAPKRLLTAERAIELIHGAGGLASLAHPGIYGNDDLIPRVRSLGIDAIECFHSAHSPTKTRRYLATADELNLLVTGGSDCHGQGKSGPLIGSVTLADDYVARLDAARAKPH
jgi:predicted metal-dependent phosphoesterase TrpH